MASRQLVTRSSPPCRITAPSAEQTAAFAQLEGSEVGAEHKSSSIRQLGGCRGAAARYAASALSHRAGKDYARPGRRTACGVRWRTGSARRWLRTSPVSRLWFDGGVQQGFRITDVATGGRSRSRRGQPVRGQRSQRAGPLMPRRRCTARHQNGFEGEAAAGRCRCGRLDQFGHLAVEEGQQQGADVGAVDVGVGHDDDAVVTQLVS